MAVAYTSRVRIERLAGGTRKATLPVDQPVLFGVHDEIAEHYKREPGTFEPHAATLDYVVAAAGGWLTGTLGGALEARDIPASDSRLIADVTGEIEKTDDGVIVVRRIHVRYRLQADPEKREVIDRVLSFHASKCPVARTLEGCVEITTELELVPV